MVSFKDPLSIILLCKQKLKTVNTTEVTLCTIKTLQPTNTQNLVVHFPVTSTIIASASE